MKQVWVERNRRRWPISLAREVLGVSPSEHHERNTREIDPAGPPRGNISNDALLQHIGAVRAETNGEYGWPRARTELRARGIRVGKRRVQKLTQLPGIEARAKRKYKATTDSNCSLPIAQIQLQRDFSRRVVSWSMKPYMATGRVGDALRMAWFRRYPTAGLTVHSNRGSQRGSHEFQKAIEDYGMRSSVGRKRDHWDNAVTESLWWGVQGRSIAWTPLRAAARRYGRGH